MSRFLWSLCLFFAIVVVGIEFGEEERECKTENIKSKNRGCRMGGDGRFEVPAGWRVDVAGKRGWLQTGVADCDFDEALREIDAIMGEAGYMKDKAVDGGTGGRKTLVRYVRPDGVAVMWMVWDRGDGTACFSWGREK